MFSAFTLDTPSMVTSLVALRPPLMNGDDPELFEEGITPGSQRGQRERVPAVQRQVNHASIFDGLANRGTGRFERRADADDADGLGGRPISSVTLNARICPTSTLTSSNVGLLNPSFLTVIHSFPVSVGERHRFRSRR